MFCAFRHGVAKANARHPAKVNRAGNLSIKGTGDTNASGGRNQPLRYSMEKPPEMLAGEKRRYDLLGTRKNRSLWLLSSYLSTSHLVPLRQHRTPIPHRTT